MNNSACLLMLAALLATFPAAAEKGDRDKPMNAESDALRYDDLKQTSVFTGNVVITKGTIIIRGARVDVKQDAEGYQTAIVVAAPDKLAFYRKKRDLVDEYIEGEGERIEYDSRADTVKFIKQAVLRRYVGAALADETTGDLIVYDNTTDVFTVDAGQKTRTAANPSGRVRAILAPRSKPAAPGTPAPAGPVPGAPVLRPSSTLSN
ncbi:MAG TPA: lipopolysaccharide transport periplasmic protein LptA [Polaromonas sp.]|uniref:lipopolysaccharide transport periplasmic protein LptA n=1 Tax=Polaromonas sp. TaxID=1869339 RepID=UPI002D2A660D|nr:lipopolysaccharide transport periplasmic protein LptA [Polaromonas sp.]HYW55650.1 lipopolysaccharide transport periplasmic protein LptA [Polaromonas sp.]